MIYALRNDDKQFQQLDLDIMDLLDYKPDSVPIRSLMSFELNNLSLKDWWPASLEAAFYAPRTTATTIPDISIWTGTTLVLSPKAIRFLGETLLKYGELLPFNNNGENWNLFNCRNLVDADFENTEYHDIGEHQGSIKSLSFPSYADKQLIFKCKQESALTPLCNTLLKDMVESSSLSGLKFDSDLIEFSD